MIVMGVDPGSSKTGFGVVSLENGRLRHIDHGVVRAHSSHTLPRRLMAIFRGIKEALKIHHPEAIAVETVFHARNARSSLILGHARGVILLAAVQEGVEVFEYSPREVKQALTGYGQAHKEQLRYMVRSLLSLRESLPLDASDALAIAICHAHYRGGCNPIARMTNHPG